MFRLLAILMASSPDACASAPLPELAPPPPPPPGVTALPPLPLPEGAKVPAQDPAEVTLRYYRLLSQIRYPEAQALWAQGTEKRGEDIEAFRRSLSPYQCFSAEVTGEPEIESAGGTLHATVPIRLTGVRRGERFVSEGSATLRRCGDVPGCTPEERRWRITGLNMDVTRPVSPRAENRR
ncbi:hypothetical protein [Parvularcula oceani]|uniref:hypothetical protein n=1 Tax=Parvularcula oceani TaxID=1247963 RepID=UPI0004E28707|nr:hypothetical protein [Parvularcula oceani]